MPEGGPAAVPSRTRADPAMVKALAPHAPLEAQAGGGALAPPWAGWPPWRSWGLLAPEHYALFPLPMRKATGISSPRGPR